MTRAEFIRGYCERSGITEFAYTSLFVALPCSCDQEPHTHWASIRLDAGQICDHLAFYCPSVDDLIDLGMSETRELLAKQPDTSIADGERE